MGMPHRHSLVGFAVEPTSNESSGDARNKLLDEDNSPPPSAVGPAPYVEAKIYLLKVSMEGNGNVQDARAEKLEPYDADKRSTGPEIEFTTRRDPIRQRVWVDNVVEHDQVAPVRFEKPALGCHWIASLPGGPVFSVPGGDADGLPDRRQAVENRYRFAAKVR